jgi:hypothetical protein
MKEKNPSKRPLVLHDSSSNSLIDAASVSKSQPMLLS